MNQTYRAKAAHIGALDAVSEEKQAASRVKIAVLLAYTLLIPQQFNVMIDTFYLSPFRIYLIVASLYIAFSAIRSNVRFKWADTLILIGMAWITLASFMTGGDVFAAIIQGGSHFMDIGLAYFLARCTILTPRDFRRFLVLFAPGVALTGAIVAIEAITHQPIVHAIATAITGQPGGPKRWDVRLGFMRGVAFFPHPILVGIFLASFLPIYLLSGLRGWPRIVGVVGAGLGVLSMSSAAMLGVVVGGLLVIYDWLTERIGNLTWKLFLGFSSLLYVIVESTSNRGFYTLLVSYASLNSVSAYNRVLIWRYGSQNVAENPWFGIGYSNWERPEWMKSDSFDWFWLILALRFGIPTAVMILGATIIAIVMIALKSRHLPSSEARLYRGVAISLAVFAIGLNSVSLWMSTLAWFAMLVGLTVSLGSFDVKPRKQAGPLRRAPNAPNWDRRLPAGYKPA